MEKSSYQYTHRLGISVKSVYGDGIILEAIRSVIDDTTQIKTFHKDGTFRKFKGLVLARIIMFDEGTVVEYEPVPPKLCPINLFDHRVYIRWCTFSPSGCILGCEPCTSDGDNVRAVVQDIVRFSI